MTRPPRLPSPDAAPAAQDGAQADNVRALMPRHQVGAAPATAAPDPATAAAILEGIADGNPLRATCDAYGIKPRAFYAWLAADPALSAAYDAACAERDRARTDEADTYAREALAIADASEGDTYVGEHGERRVDYEAIARSKLRVDTRMLLAAKLAPSKYGARPEDASAGKIVIEVRDPTRGPHAARDAGKGDPSPPNPAPIPPRTD